MCGLGCVKLAGARARVTQPSPCIFLHISRDVKDRASMGWDGTMGGKATRFRCLPRRPREIGCLENYGGNFSNCLPQSNGTLVGKQIEVDSNINSGKQIFLINRLVQLRLGMSYIEWNQIPLLPSKKKIFAFIYCGGGCNWAVTGREDSCIGNKECA